MNKLKNEWRRVPNKPRKGLVLVVGFSLILASAIVGSVPGPGGIIVFALGIAVLGSEFRWADRFGQWVLNRAKDFNNYLREHRLISILFWTLIVAWLLYVVLWLLPSLAWYD